MHFLFFIIYLAALTYLITRIPFIRKCGLPLHLIIALFLIKVFAGLAIGWISQKFYPGNDYWGLNKDALVEYKILINDPAAFFSNIFYSPYEDKYAGFFNAVGSYWNDLRDNIILKMLAFCDLFSGGHYYINSLFFNFLGFFGPVALFRFFSAILKNNSRAIIIGCFLLPSTVYFSSGIHKDLVVFTLTGLFFYALYFISSGQQSKGKWALLLLSFTGLLLMRNFIIIGLLPALAAFFISKKKSWAPLATFVSIYFIGFFLLFLSQTLVPSFQPLKLITQRQSDFNELPVAATQLPAIQLAPTVTSLAKNAPEAFDHSFLRPYIWDTKSSYLLPLAVELIIYQLLILIVFLKYRSSLQTSQPYIILGFFFGISMIMLTGYIIPNVGSIVRYRSLYLPFIITPFLCAIWPKFRQRKRIIIKYMF